VIDKDPELLAMLKDSSINAQVSMIIYDALDLGTGNRSITPGGHLDPKYLITVPARLGLT
jgi:hypothetical protein